MWTCKKPWNYLLICLVLVSVPLAAVAWDTDLWTTASLSDDGASFITGYENNSYFYAVGDSDSSPTVVQAYFSDDLGESWTDALVLDLGYDVSNPTIAMHGTSQALVFYELDDTTTPNYGIYASRLQVGCDTGGAFDDSCLDKSVGCFDADGKCAITNDEEARAPWSTTDSEHWTTAYWTYVAWIGPGTNSGDAVYFTRTDSSAGEGFNAPTIVADDEVDINQVVIDYERSGSSTDILHLVFDADVAGTHVIRYYKSTNFGSAWTHIGDFTDTYDMTYPVVAANLNDVYITWQYCNGGGSCDYDIVYTYDDAIGEGGFTAGYIDLADAVGDETNPSVSVDQSGTPWFIYTDDSGVWVDNTTVKTLSQIADGDSTTVADRNSIYAIHTEINTEYGAIAQFPAIGSGFSDTDLFGDASWLPLTSADLSPAGVDCSDPLIVPINIPGDLPFTDLGNTNCGGGHTYEDTCLGSYDSGEDMIYVLNVTTDTDVEISLDPKSTTWTGIALDTSCPLDTTTCLDTSTTSGASVHGLSCQTLTAGTYYIQVDTWTTPDCIPELDLSITDCSIADDDDDVVDDDDDVVDDDDDVVDDDDDVVDDDDDVVDDDDDVVDDDDDVVDDDDDVVDDDDDVVDDDDDVVDDDDDVVDDDDDVVDDDDDTTDDDDDTTDDDDTDDDTPGTSGDDDDDDDGCCGC